MKDETTRRGFLKQTARTAAYVAPAVLTLDVSLAEARSGSGSGWEDEKKKRRPARAVKRRGNYRRRGRKRSFGWW